MIPEGSRRHPRHLLEETGEVGLVFQPHSRSYINHGAVFVHKELLGVIESLNLNPFDGGTKRMGLDYFVKIVG